jgi:hypothetical protein
MQLNASNTQRNILIILVCFAQCRPACYIKATTAAIHDFNTNPVAICTGQQPNSDGQLGKILGHAALLMNDFIEIEHFQHQAAASGNTLLPRFGLSARCQSLC